MHVQDAGGRKVLPLSRRDYWGVMEPNSPCASLAGPAVKYNALAGPAPEPLPNDKPRRPATASGEPLEFLTTSLILPVAGSNAAIAPLPNWPTSRVLLRAPKLFGAIARPQGAFIQLPCWTLPVRAPTDEKTLT